MTFNYSKLQKILERSVDNKKVFGTTFALKKDDSIWEGAAGNFSIGQPFFIASTTKLFTSAIIFKLLIEGKLDLDDSVRKHLSEKNLSGLHLYKGKDYSNSITIKHLLSHTSGLPDYFQDKDSEGKSLESQLTSGKDQSWTFEQTLEWSKNLSPHFIPGTKGKAHYSDTNFQLLGAIISNVTNNSFAENCEKYIFDPLFLRNTYVYSDDYDGKPKNFYFKQRELPIPKAMSSFGPDGGIVSTTSDLLFFIEAFFNGKIFPKNIISQIQVWNNIFFPMKAGIGIHQFKLPWIFNPFGTVPSFIGHSGLSGALAYYCPKNNLYVVGTVNQVAYPDTSFRTMIKIISA